MGSRGPPSWVLMRRMEAKERSWSAKVSKLRKRINDLKEENRELVKQNNDLKKRIRELEEELNTYLHQT